MQPTPDRWFRLVGVVHLRPLPGSPRWEGSLQAVQDAAAADAAALAEGGADAVVVENFGDRPFTGGTVPPETVAAMALAAGAVRDACGLPLGFNVLRNDAFAALALAATGGGAFIRVNVLCGAAVTDQGLIEGRAFEVARRRASLCPEVAVWADVHVKHAAPLGDVSLAEAARDTRDRALADALIVSGTGTGRATAIEDLEVVRTACPDAPLYVGSGATPESAPGLLEIADGLIVGTALKRDGDVGQPVDPDRVRRFRDAVG